MGLREINKIRIDGTDYKVKFCEPNPLMDTYGTFDLAKSEIHIALNGDDCIFVTLWHEILHCIAQNRLGNSLNEAETESLANAIVQVLKDNSELAMYAITAGIEFEPEEETEEVEDEDAE